MNDNVALVLACLVGAALGAVFFGGLWWTVRKGLTSKQPALWFFGSMLVRMGIVVAGFYAISGSQWQRLLACLLGFVMARAGVMWLTRPVAEESRNRDESISRIASTERSDLR